MASTTVASSGLRARNGPPSAGAGRVLRVTSHVPPPTARSAAPTSPFLRKPRRPSFSPGRRTRW